MWKECGCVCCMWDNSRAELQRCPDIKALQQLFLYLRFPVLKLVLLPVVLSRWPRCSPPTSWATSEPPRCSPSWSLTWYSRPPTHTPMSISLSAAGMVESSGVNIEALEQLCSWEMTLMLFKVLSVCFKVCFSTDLSALC